jgi:hypothetical protein
MFVFLDLAQAAMGLAVSAGFGLLLYPFESH